MRTLTVGIVLAVVLALTPVRAGAELRVLSDFTDFAALAGLIGGDRVKAEAMGRGDVDPHFQEPLPSYVVKLNKADVFITNGLELSIGWIPALMDQARNPKIQRGAPGYVFAGEGIPILDVPTSPVSRVLGDVHPAGDPHYTTNPANFLVVARNIRDAFERVDPAGKAAYEQNYNQFVTHWQTKLLEWKKALEPYQGAKLVTYHKYWDYLADYFGLDIIDHIEPKPGIPPSGAHLLQLAELMQQQHCRVIVRNPWDGAKASELLADKAHAQVIVLAGAVGALPEAATLEGMFDYNVQTLAKALQAAGAAPAQEGTPQQ